PRLQLADAAVEATSRATFVEIAGRPINELTARTTFAESRLVFDAVARHEMRELEAAGSAVFHPDHQEIHLSDVSLRAEGVEWRTAPGSEAAIRYGRDRIVVENVELQSGDQRIAANGVLGSPSESLDVQAVNVDLAQLDALLLTQQRLAGRLTADAAVSGPIRDPRVEGEFTLTDGAFRAFKFQSLSGKVDYAGRTVTIDVRLQQTPEAWLTAQGRAPVTLFRPNPPGLERVHDAPAPGDEVDIRIAMSTIDLGLVQGFTGYVTNVTGTLQADVHVTGSGYDPHFTGAIDIRGGAFEIPQLGTRYTGLDTRIDLQPDELAVREFKILDSRGFPMTIGGTLAVHERALGDVNVSIRSENFEFIDNRLADLKLDTDLRISGDLRRPRIEGVVEVENGTIFAAEVVQETTRDPYAIAEIPPAGADQAARAVAAGQPDAAPAEPPPTFFQGLELNVALAIPSNLVIRGNEIRPAHAPIDIGDVTATVGGAVQIRKDAGGPIRLVGEVNTVRGTYTFQGRRFDILRGGRIRFVGTEPIDPLIDVQARRVISGVETIVRIHGTMRQPELAFSSSPPLDQADILSLIVFNAPVNELGVGQQISLAERAAALAGGYLASGLARSIGSALELDEFEIVAQGERGGPTLSLGEQVGEHLFFRIRQGFGNAQATEFILEYQIADYLRLQASAAEAPGGERVTFRRVERGGIDLIFFFSY
ncbi:MAG TPA: translocation/assembly module TamB domain-containing protein, partial [Vicinamibacterales bacterium]|nr:translocation/assembly module TamB domain-containing protein [Vicinamibacterales bacterium]